MLPSPTQLLQPAPSKRHFRPLSLLICRYSFPPPAFQTHRFQIITSLLPPTLHFCLLPLLLSMSSSPAALAQAGPRYSPPVLIPDSDCADGFCAGGRGGGREGNPTAPRLGFSEELSFESLLRAVREGVPGFLCKSPPAPCSSLPRLGWVLGAIPCCCVLQGWW